MRQMLRACGLIVLLASNTGLAQSLDQELRRYAACFDRELGITPRWAHEIDVIHADSARWYGWTNTNGLTLNARTVFNTFTIARDGINPRQIALHEALHVFMGELTGLAFAFDEQLASMENERLVRQMVRWPWWRSVCR